MAILRSGFGGKISGKVGNMVYYVGKDGRQEVRKAPKSSSKEPSHAQLVQRARFISVTSFLRYFKPVFQILPKPVWPKNLEHFNLAVRYVLKEALIGEYPDFKIDYGKVRLIANQGFLEGSAENIHNRISFKWVRPDPYESSSAIMVAFSPTSKLFIFGMGEIDHENSTCALQLPEDLNDEYFETWLILLSRDGKTLGRGSYCGRVGIGSSSCSGSSSSSGSRSGSSSSTSSVMVSLSNHRAGKES